MCSSETGDWKWLLPLKQEGKLLISYSLALWNDCIEHCCALGSTSLQRNVLCAQTVTGTHTHTLMRSHPRTNWPREVAESLHFSFLGPQPSVKGFRGNSDDYGVSRQRWQQFRTVQFSISQEDIQMCINTHTRRHKQSSRKGTTSCCCVFFCQVCQHQVSLDVKKVTNCSWSLSYKFQTVYPLPQL